MIIEIVSAFVMVCLTIQEWLANPRKILERLHISTNGEPSEKPYREPEDETEEESEFPIWEFDD